MARSAHREAVVSFAQALGALRYLPESRTRSEQACDLRLDLRTALLALGELGRVFEYLREAETLAIALDDPHRLERVSLFMTSHYTVAGDYDRAIVTGQRALALAMAGGVLGTQLQGHFYLGQAYYHQGEYHRAIDSFQRAIASLEGTLHYE